MYGFFFNLCFKQKTAYDMRISDWSSDVCSSDLLAIWQQLPLWMGLGAEISVIWAIQDAGDGFDLRFGGHLVLRHRSDCPAVVIAKGAARSEERRVGTESVSKCRSWL